MLALANTPLFSGFIGVLDAGGKASARLDTGGPLPGAIATTTLYFAYAAFSPLDFASTAIAVDIVP